MADTLEHRREANARLSPIGRRFFSLIEYDENEKLVLEIRKHPFGLLLLLVLGLIVSTIIAVVPMIMAIAIRETDLVELASSINTVETVMFIIGIVLGFGGLVVTLINAILYRNNVIFVTTEKIAQVLYMSLFNRKISQLSIGDVQDVTVTQNGVFPHLFNYGKLVIETAGEQQNYMFTYVPNPYKSAQIIVGAHEENLKHYGN